MFKTEKVRVGTSVYTIKKAGAKELRGYLGCTNSGKKTIEIDMENEHNHHNNELLDTLVHEILHTIFIEQDMENILDIDKELHEKIVINLSKGLVGIYVDNPSLLKDITTLATKARKDLSK